MKVAVDRELCQGHEQCQDVAPELFELRDEDGLADVIAQPDSPELGTARRTPASARSKPC